MAREELITALKNAMERGESLQKAMKTITSAGYDPKEVQEAAKFANTSILHLLQTENKEESESINPEPNGEIPVQQSEKQNNSEAQVAENIPSPTNPQENTTDSGYKKLPTTGVTPTPEEPPKKKSKALKILITLIVLLIIFLGFFMLFGEKILSSLIS